jgi:hypothetical protein
MKWSNMRTRLLLLALPVLFVGCALFQGTDGDPAPISEGLKAGGKVAVEKLAEGDYTGAIIGGLSALIIATVGAYEVRRRRRKAVK